jgi:hypothetical protein
MDYSRLKKYKNKTSNKIEEILFLGLEFGS